MAIKKIAVGGISTECSTYSTLYQNESDFVSLQGLSCPSFMALSNGSVNQDLKNIENHHRKKPTFPFQEVNEFVPQVSDGLNVLS